MRMAEQDTPFDAPTTIAGYGGGRPTTAPRRRPVPIPRTPTPGTPATPSPSVPVTTGPGRRTIITRVGPGGVNPWNPAHAPQVGGPDPGNPNDLRPQVYTPGSDPRLQKAQGASDVAAGAVQTGANYGQMVQGATDRYRSMYGTGQVDFRGVDSSIPFQGVGTTVAGERLNPNVRFQGINPNVTSRRVDPNAQFERVNTNVAAERLNPNLQFQGVNPNVTAEQLDPNARFRSIDATVAAGPDVAAQDPGRYLSEQDQALSALGGPSRTELAMQALKDFQTQGQRDLQNRFRAVGQSAAKFGRLGLGDVNAELGSIQGDYERDLLAKQNELARSVAEGDIVDRFRRLDAASGLRGQEAGISSGLRGEARQERQYGTGLAERNVARTQDERDAALAASERNIGRQFQNRDFLTGLGERNLARAQSERDAGLQVAADNYARQASERAFGTGLGERNVARTQAERDAALGLAERNIGRQFQGQAFDTGLAERNFGRAQSERDAGLQVAADNYGRQASERAFGTGLAERNLGRSATERDAALAAAERQYGRNINERDTAMGLSERNVGRGFDRLSASIGAGQNEAGNSLADRYRRLNAAQGYEDQLFGQGQSNRNEYRIERGRQDQLAQQSIDNRIRERRLGNDEMDQRLRQALALSQVGGAGAPSLDDILRAYTLGGR